MARDVKRSQRLEAKAEARAMRPRPEINLSKWKVANDD